MFTQKYSAYIENKKWKKHTVFLVFSVILILGCCFFKDYGISWDEPIERKNGIFSTLTAISFLTGSAEIIDLSQWNDRYYGNGLQHILLLSDYLSGCLQMTPHGNAESWTIRHLLTFLFTIIGLYFMYLTGTMIWKDRLKAVIPVILFLFIPRLVADSFYNIKDVGLLSGMMIGGYFIVRYVLHPSCFHAVLLGFAAAFACSIRLFGLQLIVFGIFFSVVINTLGKNKGSYKNLLFHFLAMLISFTIFVVLFYPACWGSNPFSFFSNAVTYMANHPWAGTIRFCGKDYVAGTTPWYYLIVWIAVTTPIPVLLLLFCGSVCLIKKLYSARKMSVNRRIPLIMLMFFFMFWGELLLLPFVVKNCYNGWRHFYFLGYPMLMICSCGMINIVSIAKKSKKCTTVFASVLVFIIALHISWMITQHPHQYLYFNILAKNPQNDFELDYWHVSNKNGIRKIIERNKNNFEHKTLAYDYVIYPALAMFRESEINRLHVVSRFGFHDYMILVNDNKCHTGKYEERFSQKETGKLISDEIVWIKNSLWTKQVMAYRIVEFEKYPGAEILRVKY